VLAVVTFPMCSSNAKLCRRTNVNFVPAANTLVSKPRAAAHCIERITHVCAMGETPTCGAGVAALGRNLLLRSMLRSGPNKREQTPREHMFDALSTGRIKELMYDARSSAETYPRPNTPSSEPEMPTAMKTGLDGILSARNFEIGG